MPLGDIPARFSVYSGEWAANKYVRSAFYIGKELSTRRLPPSAFEYEEVLALAIKRGDLNRNRIANVPDEKWWRKLCKAAGDKVTSRYGGVLLRDRIAHFLQNRLLLEDTWHYRQDEIMKEVIKEPIFIIGNPRSNKHFAAHIYCRGGYTMPLRYCDTMFCGIPNEEQRQKAAKDAIRGFRWIHPTMQSVRAPINALAVDDDIALQLQSPQSLAWGLLHGLPEYLYECIQEDQTPVYEHSKKVLQVLSWYRTCGQYSDGVRRENVPIDNPVDRVIDGLKDELKHDELPWLIHSPLGILNMRELHGCYPDMRVIWMHRALNASVASMCSAVCLHDCMYTGKPPRETVRTEVGEMVLGLFGSGSEHAIDYMGTFPRDRMVHWGFAEHRRHGIRLTQKTHVRWWKDTMDTFRKFQAINGSTEMFQTFRPRNDADLEMFGLHEGMVNDSFRAYVFQFEEYCFDKKYGMEIQEYQPVAGTFHESAYGLLDRNSVDRVTSLEQMPLSGHLLQAYSANKPVEYAFSRPTPKNTTLQSLPPK
jgi:hypothetical protein